jgi:hypothetical protein
VWGQTSPHKPPVCTSTKKRLVGLTKGVSEDILGVNAGALGIEVTR